MTTEGAEMAVHHRNGDIVVRLLDDRTVLPMCKPISGTVGQHDNQVQEGVRSDHNKLIILIM